MGRDAGDVEVDVLSWKERGGEDTTPERIVRSLVGAGSACDRMGYRFPLHVRIPLLRSATVSKTSRSTDALNRIGFPRDRSKGLRLLRLMLAHTTALPALSQWTSRLPKHKTAIFVHGCGGPTQVVAPAISGCQVAVR